MNIFQILGFIKLATDTIVAVEQAHKGEGGSGKVKKAEVESVLYASISALEVSGKLSITDRKGFNKDVSHLIDNIVGICNKSDWK